MKLRLTLLIILFAYGHLFSQDAKPAPLFRHEIGIDAYPVIQNIFKYPGFSPPGDMSGYNIMYRLHIRNYGYLRLRMMLNNMQNGGYTYNMTGTKRITEETIDPNMNNNFAIRLGWQFNKNINNRSDIYGGLDLVINSAKTSYGNQSTVRDSANSSRTLVTSNSSSNKSNNIGLGGSFFGGISFKLGPHFNISYEISLNLIRNRTRQNYQQLSMYREYNSQSLLLYEKINSDNKIHYTEKTTIQQLVPLSILMLSYIF